MRLLLLAAAGALVLAGCTSPSPPDAGPQGGAPQPTSQAQEVPPPPAANASTPNATSPPPVGLVVFPFQGRLTSGAAVNSFYLSPTGSLEPHVFPFTVEAGAVAVVLELRWADNTFDLDIVVESPSFDGQEGYQGIANGGTHGAGDSPVRVAIDDPAVLQELGEWSLGVWGKNAVNVEFTAAASVFYGVGPLQDYTALG